MKSKLTFLFTTITLFGLLLQPSAEAFQLNETQAYDGVATTNYFANSVLTEADRIVERSTAAYDEDDSFGMPREADSFLYVGFEEPFDGFAMDLENAATGGAFKVTYWNGSSWSTLIAEADESIRNDSTSGVFQLEWDRPSNWDARSFEIDTPEDEDEDSTDELYFARLEVTENYNSVPLIEQVGITTYNLVLNVETELEDGLSVNEADFDFISGGNTTVYAHKRTGYEHHFALHSLGGTYTYSVNKSGYIEEEFTAQVDTDQNEEDIRLDYTHVIRATDADDGENVSITSAEAGTEDVTCVIDNGDAYCPVDTDDDNSTARVEANNYETHSFTLPNRTNDGGVQKISNIEMEQSGSSNPSSDDVDLFVSDLSVEDEELTVTVKNIGEEDLDEAVDLYVYIENERVASYEVGENYLEADDIVNVNFDLEELEDLDEEVSVRACIDANDEADEDNENNNCRTEDFGENNSNDEEVDFEVTEIFGDEHDFYYTLANTGDEDANGSIHFEVTVEQNGREERVLSGNHSSSSGSSNFFDAGGESTFDSEDLLEEYFEDGDDFDVTVCIDTEDDFDEENENNNCMTVDDSELDEGLHYDSCGSFNDIVNHWAEEYICELYDSDIVEGRSHTRFYPDSAVTRAEFLKMTLLGLGYDTHTVSAVHYSDVSSSHWAYEYVTYATASGIVDGYSNGTFKPDAYISRAEALVLLLRAADQDDNGRVDEDEINFWDVDEDDWFAWAVVLADEENLISGYSDNSFRPTNSITRAEAAKIVSLANEL
ncbi:S-layer homology domain-containing protein [Candidatus Peregrinibacteria bacterium]|nr:MAG: S-layer homology domain-containing protein [Candidatus Peregrinibacteria bacterium]